MPKKTKKTEINENKSENIFSDLENLLYTFNDATISQNEKMSELQKVNDKLQNLSSIGIVSDEINYRTKNLESSNKLYKKVEVGLTGRKKAAAVFLSIVTFGAKSLKKQKEKYAKKNLDKNEQLLEDLLTKAKVIKELTEYAITPPEENFMSKSVKEANLGDKFQAVGKAIESSIKVLDSKLTINKLAKEALDSGGIKRLNGFTGHSSNKKESFAKQIINKIKGKKTYKRAPLGRISF